MAGKHGHLNNLKAMLNQQMGGKPMMPFGMRPPPGGVGKSGGSGVDGADDEESGIPSVAGKPVKLVHAVKARARVGGARKRRRPKKRTFNAKSAVATPPVVVVTTTVKTKKDEGKKKEKKKGKEEEEPKEVEVEVLEEEEELLEDLSVVRRRITLVQELEEVTAENAEEILGKLAQEVQHLQQSERDLKDKHRALRLELAGMRKRAVLMTQHGAAARAAREAQDAQAQAQAAVIDNGDQGADEELSLHAAGSRLSVAVMTVSSKKEDEADADADETVVSERVYKTGWVWKEGQKRKSWKRRFFVLYRDRVVYFKDRSSIEPLGEAFDLNGVELSPMAQRPGVEHECMQLSHAARTLNFYADDQKENVTWMAAIKNRIMSLEYSARVKAAGERPNQAIVEYLDAFNPDDSTSTVPHTGKLQLSGVALDEDTLAVLCRMLYDAEHPKSGKPSTPIASLGLVELSLDDKTVARLAESVAKSDTLATLNLSGNPIGVESMKVLISALCEPSCSVSKLTLSSTWVDDAAIELLAGSLHKTKLTKLDLSNCHMTTRGLELLADTLTGDSGADSSLVHFIISDNHFGPDAASIIARLCHEARTLICLEARNVGLLDEAVPVLVQAMQGAGNHVLRIHLADNKFSESALQQLVHGVQSDSLIERISLDKDVSISQTELSVMRLLNSYGFADVASG